MRSLLAIIATSCSSNTPTTPATMIAAAPEVEASAGPPPRVKFPIADFDGDGLADLAFTAVERPGEQCRQIPGGSSCWRPNDLSRMTLLVFLGRDRGALSQTIELARGPDELHMGRGYEVGAVGDLDGDGRTEAAITFQPGGGGETLLLLRGTGRGLSTPYQSVELPKLDSHQWYGVRPRPAGDIDGDGHPEIVLGQVILHGGSGGEVRDLSLVRPPDNAAHELVMAYPAGDVTGDGLADLVTVHRQQVHLVPGGGARPVRLAIAMQRIGAFEVADLDGDGRAELMAVASGSPLRLATYSLSATGAIATGTIAIPGDQVHGLVAADTDGSGVRDLHLIASIGRVDVPCSTTCTGPANLHLRTVRGGKVLTLDPRAPIRALSFGSGPRLYLRALGDLDGDGIEELGIVEGGKLRATRSRGGVFELDARYRATPKQIDVYTAEAS